MVAGVLPVPGLTARQALDQLDVGANTRLLITGGSGTTGGLALQLAAQAGAHVVATAAPHHHDRLRRLGAVDVLDSHDADWATNAQSTGRVAGGFDAVLVAVAGTANAIVGAGSKAALSRPRLAGRSTVDSPSNSSSSPPIGTCRASRSARALLGKVVAA